MSTSTPLSSNLGSTISSVGQSVGDTASSAVSNASTTISSTTSSIGSSLSSSGSPSISSNIGLSASTPSTNSSSFSSLFSSSSSSGQSEPSFWNSSLFLSFLGLILFIFIVGNIYMYITTGEALFWNESLSTISSITGSIRTFIDDLMNSTEVGGKGVVEVSGETVKSAAAIPDEIVKGSQDNKSSNTTKDSEEVEDSDDETETHKSQQNSLEKKIDRSSAKESAEQKGPREIDYSGPEPNETNSKSTGSSSIGFCYIGEYNGNRSCASINESSNCMSGDIFDTKEKCMNPSAYA